MNKTLLRNSFVYIVAEFINRAFPFFLLPILTRFLSPEDYGILATFSVLVSILIVLVGVNTHGAISVNFFKLDREKIRVYIANIFIVLGSSMIVFLVLTLVFGEYFSRILSIPEEWIVVAVVIAGMQFITTVNLMLWTLEKNPKAYAIYQIIQSLFVVVLTLVFIIGIGMKWEGQVLAKAIATIVFSLISVIYIIKRRYLKFKLDTSFIRDALKFSAPLVPYSLAAWVRNGADKFLIVALVGTSATGLYSVGYQIGLIVSVLITAVNKAWGPYLLKILNTIPTEQEKKKFVVMTYGYGLGLLLFAYTLGVLAELFMPILVGEEFSGASEFVFWIALAYAFQGMNYMVVGYLFFQKKTVALAVSNVMIAIFHIALGYALIISLGPIGAAYATVISFFISFVWTWWLSQKAYPMPWNIFKKRNNG